MRKKSIKYPVDRFEEEVDEVAAFLDDCLDLTDQHRSWAYDHGIIRLYRAFERMMLEVLIGVMNNDTATVAEEIGVPLPKHLTDEVCQYFIIGTGYFDFKGRDGLLQVLRRFLPEKHWLRVVVKKDAYLEPLDLLVALRNFAAHGSTRARAAAKQVTGQERFSSAGAWLKSQDRFDDLAKNIRLLADDIRKQAPR